MTIYIDVVLIENLCMNYIILFATAHILKIKKSNLRIIISALIGGVYAILSYMNIIEAYSNIIFKVILSIAMIYLAFIPKTFKTMIKELLVFYLVSFVFGGCAFSLLYIIKPQEIIMKNGTLIGTYPLKVTVLGAMIGFIVMISSFYFIKSRISKKDLYCEIEIFLKEKHCKVKTLIDTGNMLKDPITKMPVVVVEKDKLKDVIGKSVLDNLENIVNGIDIEDIEFISKFKVIPFKSLGKENGLLIGFKPSKIILEKDDKEYQIDNAIVGIYEKTLSKNSKYSALIGLDLIEGRNEDELFTNVS